LSLEPIRDGVDQLLEGALLLLGRVSPGGGVGASFAPIAHRPEQEFEAAFDGPHVGLEVDEQVAR
jgi:hypothetical protein